MINPEVFSLMNDMLLDIDNFFVCDVETIGSGGFGTVYNVFLNVDGEILQLAEKQMDLLNDGEIVGNNLREANVYRLVSGFDQVVKAGSIFFGKTDRRIKINVDMDLMVSDLKSFCKELDVDIRLSIFKNIFMDICLGLMNVHKNGLVHGDIKPQNILINSESRAFLTDFSAVKFEKNDTCFVNCTMAYRAPELFSRYRTSKNKKIPNYKKFGTYNDIWSLGITMLYFLTGENRCEGSNDISKFILRDKPFPVERIFVENGLSTTEHKFYYDLICSMLKREYYERVSIFSVYKTLGGGDIIYKSVNLDNSINSRIYNDKRAKCIVSHHNYLKDENKKSKHCFQLAVNICDRYCSITGKEYSMELLTNCLYVSMNFLLDSNDITNKVYFYESIMMDNIDGIMSIVEILDFNVYRETLFSYIQERMKIGKTGEEVIFKMMGEVENHQKTNSELYFIFKDRMKIAKRMRKNYDVMNL